MTKQELKEIIQNIKNELKEIRIDIGERPKQPFIKNGTYFKFHSDELKDNFNDIIKQSFDYVSKQGNIYEFTMYQNNEDFIQDKWTLLFHFTTKPLNYITKY